ncbi:hypothetical protein [Gordonia westfalica]|uniref:Uncharacterized protein n=1 Tax=Gordonia westfalica TaxID=158898 RepID=A0A1H2DPF2_9ACTN|nr:hypothetical protein [Gordonia westfalica]SDT84729.1 hypothetical protein SAMN04488548_11034 [Gordonia westfalica]
MGEPVDVIRLLAHAATANIASIINGIFNGWFGGGSVGDPQEVQYTIQAIADAVLNGYNVETKVTSGTWTKPENITELIVGLIGCGKNGSDGTSSTTTAQLAASAVDTFSSNSTPNQWIRVRLTSLARMAIRPVSAPISPRPQGRVGSRHRSAIHPPHPCRGTAAVVV